MSDSWSRKWRKFKAAVKDAWAPPCQCCGGPSVVCESCAKEAHPTTIPLSRARLCLEDDCESIFSSEFNQCPRCSSSQWRPVGFYYQDSPRGRKARERMRLVKAGAK